MIPARSPNARLSRSLLPPVLRLPVEPLPALVHRLACALAPRFQHVFRRVGNPERDRLRPPDDRVLLRVAPVAPPVPSGFGFEVVAWSFRLGRAHFRPFFRRRNTRS